MIEVLKKKEICFLFAQQLQNSFPAEFRILFIQCIYTRQRILYKNLLVTKIAWKNPVLHSVGCVVKQNFEDEGEGGFTRLFQATYDDRFEPCLGVHHQVTLE